MYNKDAILEFLLAPPPSADNPISTRPFGADGLLAAGHLRSLKDLQNLRLTPVSSDGGQGTSASNAQAGGQNEYGSAKYECPITLRGMNGAVRFVYVQGCGCVASEVGLKELAGVNAHSPQETENEGVKEPRKAMCPICAKDLPGTKVQMVTLNPVGEEKEAMMKAWTERVAKEEKEKADRKAAKKSKKRNLADGTDLVTEEAPETKKVKKSTTILGSQPAPVINRKLPSMPDIKKPLSKAVASLYSSQKDPASKLSPFFSSGYSRVG